MYHLALGSINTARSYCPSQLMGNFHYTYNDGSTDYCGTNSEWDVCTDRTTMVFKYDKCSIKQAFSGQFSNRFSNIQNEVKEVQTNSMNNTLRTRV